MDNNANEYQEYITFSVTTSAGEEVEMAVVDEFEFDRKNYVVSSLIEGDTVNEDAVYIYESVMTGDDFSVKKIEDEKTYFKVAEAYMQM